MRATARMDDHRASAAREPSADAAPAQSECLADMCWNANCRTGPSWYRVDRQHCQSPLKAGTQCVGGVLELKQLRYFLSVAEHGAFSKAAMVLSVGQPV